MVLKKNDSFLDEALNLLDSAKGKTLPLENRKQLSIKLASLFLQESQKAPNQEKKKKSFYKILGDLQTKTFVIHLLDQCFRTLSPKRIANQIALLLLQFGIPPLLPFSIRLKLLFFNFFSRNIAHWIIPWIHQDLTKELFGKILPIDYGILHLNPSKGENFSENRALIDETFLGTALAEEQFQKILNDLEAPQLSYLSLKLSQFNPMNLLQHWELHKDALAERLKQLYRKASLFPVKHSKWKKKFIMLEVDSYESLLWTFDLFRTVLEDPEFLYLSAGIVLPAYFPDAHHMQQELTLLAKKRKGAPIKITLVKGGFLRKEQTISSKKGWPLATFPTKEETDANFKKMLLFGLDPKHASSVHLGIATHHLFDLSFALLLQAENQVQEFLEFEFFAEREIFSRKILQKLFPRFLIHRCFCLSQNISRSIPYIIQQIDATSDPDNFLQKLSQLKFPSSLWDEQVLAFSQSCEKIPFLSSSPRKDQNRTLFSLHSKENFPFQNDPPTDFSLKENRLWSKNLTEKWKQKENLSIPLCIGEKWIEHAEKRKIEDPAKGISYSYSLAQEDEIEHAFQEAQKEEKKWTRLPYEERRNVLIKVSQNFKWKREDFLALLLLDGKKILKEADLEICQAIDEIAYYCKRLQKMHSLQDLSWSAKGTVLVLSSWKSACSFPVGAIAAALLTGNRVLFKPSLETLLLSWHLAKTFWEGGVPQTALQFIPCSEKICQDVLLHDPRISSILFSGRKKTETFIKRERPYIPFYPLTEGINSMILSSLADRDLAIQNLLFSAFSHSGQNDFASSIAFIEAEVYEDPSFRSQLKDLAASLKVGLSWELATQIGPLMHEPDPFLQKELTELKDSEQWLLPPQKDPNIPNLWSPGIKLGCQQTSLGFQHRSLGPVLSLIKVPDFHTALKLVKELPYSLVSSLQSLDRREQIKWMRSTDTLHKTLNLKSTETLVRKSPFGYAKQSPSTQGFKIGGPNYLLNTSIPQQIHLPKEKHPLNEAVNNLSSFIEHFDFSAEELGLWYSSIANYGYWWNKLKHDHDPAKILGLDHFFGYIPKKSMVFRVEKKENPLDVLRICSAALSCGCPLELSWDEEFSSFNWDTLSKILTVAKESSKDFLKKISQRHIRWIRVLKNPSEELRKTACLYSCGFIEAPVLANGRYELLHYLEEITFSYTYHRYGNLGLREEELRNPLF